jgi:hypothetical protein
VWISVNVLSFPEVAAEAIALVNQEAIGGLAQGNDAGDPENRPGLVPLPGSDFPIAGNFPGTANERHNLIYNSIYGNIGIVGVNQDTGNLNNQANAYAVALTEATNAGAFGNAEASASQYNLGNTVWEIEVEPFFELNTPRKVDILRDSLYSNTGITSANQSAGNMNNQANVVAISFTH